jgi:hypothetical protein
MGIYLLMVMVTFAYCVLRNEGRMDNLERQLKISVQITITSSKTSIGETADDSKETAEMTAIRGIMETRKLEIQAQLPNGVHPDEYM